MTVEKLLLRFWGSSGVVSFLRMVAQAGTAFLTLDTMILAECDYQAYLDYEEKYLIPIWEKQPLATDLEVILMNHSPHPPSLYETLVESMGL